MSQITTHVLDAALGMPAEGISVALDGWRDGGWVSVASGMTDADGRVRDLGSESVDDGTYRLSFGTGEYFSRSGRDTFYPEVTVVFAVATGDHYHVPILLSPYSYSTYRGS
ncbi:hydroxyisourate hydrolase [Herbiconiux sp. L3-i23]|uniref:hydroxyisourate hydrolase n=1 Tax=Herbiconiux sp. L3-i23 TaxID=2905871 RepID=UPI00205E65FF|nr:hydroxyisourate hydrolase [Herbiconiux sp. L3-i23]BDI21414.1 5-hydroxyisourate hydrolase [Herbiconiux sp. L3-i23]